MSTQLLTLWLDDEQPIQTHIQEGDNILVTSQEGVTVIASVKGQKIVGLFASHADGHHRLVTLMRINEYGPTDGQTGKRANICYVCVDRFDGSRRCFRIPCDALSDAWV